MTLALGVSVGGELQVRGTADGAVTGSIRSPALTSGTISADASDRAFFVAGRPSCTAGPTITRFYRISVTDSGRLRGYATVGAPVTVVSRDALECSGDALGCSACGEGEGRGGGGQGEEGCGDGDVVEHAGADVGGEGSSEEQDEAEGGGDAQGPHA